MSEWMRVYICMYVGGDMYTCIHTSPSWVDGWMDVYVDLYVFVVGDMCVYMYIYASTGRRRVMCRSVVNERGW